MSVVTLLLDWIKSQKIKGPQMKDAPTFYRNWKKPSIYAVSIIPCSQTTSPPGSSAPPLTSAPMICYHSVQPVRFVVPFLDELAANPTCDDVEAEIAAFYGAKTALIVGSGYEANTTIHGAVPRPGDAIVYDELVHASTHDSMMHSLAQCRIQFRHNDVDALRDAISSIFDSQPMIANGSRSVLIPVETKEMCPLGNAVFIADEVHATGILGPKGAGLVSQLGVEKDIAIRLHTCGVPISTWR
ncbi:Pyridoxal phosphate-dependent transferase major domain protein [Penicillium chrysogenum]|nr:Pyridoxal phosphate-dependent transferase major domain protein [Penicillium chrysogenum]